MGIDVPSGKPHQFHGFDLKEVRGFTHTVNLQVSGFPHWIDVEAVFIESEVMPILGQQGFFEYYQVVFERYKRKFEINSKNVAIMRNNRGHGRGR